MKPIPDGYHVVTPYLVAAGAARLIEFLKQAFDAEETERLAAPGGLIGHAEVRIADSAIMIGDARPDVPAMPTMLYLYVHDADAIYHRALAAGATSLQPPTDQFYGDRSGAVVDPAGNQWWIATRIEDLTKDELARRAAAAIQRASQS